MRWGLIMLLGAVLLASCGSTKGLHPSAVDFGDVYLGDERTVDLSLFTLDGQPLKNPQFDLLSHESSFSFDMVQAGPLRTPPLLVFTPKQEGPLQQGFTISVGGKVYEVQATGRGKPVTTCPASEFCRPTTFSFVEGKCVTENAPEGALCGFSDCEGEHLCHDGVCTSVPPENFPPVCRQDVPLVTLQPAWTYEADPDREVLFPGLADDAGNLYLYDCQRIDGARRCDIVSLTADGQRRWRIPESVLPAYPDTPELATIGRSLFVTGTVSTRKAVLAFRLSDGSRAWGRSDVSAIVPAGPGSVAAVIDNRNPALDATVAALDAESGLQRYQLNGAVPGWTNGLTVSDGYGTLYTNSGPVSDAPPLADNALSAVSLEQGRLWTTTFKGNDNVCATDGTRLFMAGEQVLSARDGNPLFADPGLRSDVCLNPTRQAIFTTLPGPGMIRDCRESNLRRLGLNDGREQSSCRVREDDVSHLILTPLIPTRDGGTVFLTGSSSPESDPREKVSLRYTDADGNAIFRAQLDGLGDRQVHTVHGPAAIVNGRWVMSATVPSGRTAIVAYDVPGLALAEHGWMSPGGSQARSSAPW